MTEQFSESDFGKARPKGHIPYMPDRDATLATWREWISNAIGLPSRVRVESVFRAGRDEDDALVLTLSNDMVLRCDKQKRLHTPRGFLPFLFSASDGLCRPQALSQPEVNDVYLAMCILATTVAERTELDELRERLDTFVAMCEKVHRSLVPHYRYATLRALQKRAEYDRHAASESKQGRHTVRPVLLADGEWNKHLIRHGEFITYLRVVHMLTVNDNFLKGRMAELGCEYHSLQAHGPGRRGHLSLRFYELPSDVQVPHNTDE